MNLSKNGKVLVVIGLVTLVAVGALGFFVFDAIGRKAEAEETLDGAIATVKRLYGSAITPTEEAIADIKANTLELDKWWHEAYAFGADGDCEPLPETNEAAFKQQLIDESRELMKLPGGVDGAIVAPDFTFGFKDYIAGGLLPEKDKLPLLQKQWRDICGITEMLAGCGIVELTKIDMANAATPSSESAPKNNKKKRTAKKAEAKSTIESLRYEVEFRARPLALVKVFNAIASGSRFIVVDSFSFSREGDMIASSLSGEKDKSASASRSSKRRRASVSDEGEVNGKKGLVTDPEEESAFMVKMSLSVYDFGSKSAESAKEVAE